MLRKITISNFRSLATNVTFEPGRLNFLVGINGSGKSNVLHALTFMREAVLMGLPGAVTNNNSIEAVRRHSSGHPRNVKIDLEITLQDGLAKYGFEITGARSEEYRVKSEWAYLRFQGHVTEFRIVNGKWDGPDNLKPNIDNQNLAITSLGGDERIKPLRDFLTNMMMYSIYPDVLREPQKYNNITPMQPRGDNWISILYQQERAYWKKDLISALDKLTGEIDDLRVKKASGYLMAEFRHKGRGQKEKKWFGADLESDGTLRVAGLITALLQEPPLSVIGIEEPELTVHPGALSLIYDYLEEASHRSQIFVTTHSPILLDIIKDFKEVKVFVMRREDSASRLSPLSESHKEAVKDKLFTLGEIMLSGDLPLYPLADI